MGFAALLFAAAASGAGVQPAALTLPIVRTANTPANVKLDQGHNRSEPDGGCAPGRIAFRAGRYRTQP
jgi:hypothetical protein